MVSCKGSTVHACGEGPAILVLIRKRALIPLKYRALAYRKNNFHPFEATLFATVYSDTLVCFIKNHLNEILTVGTNVRTYFIMNYKL